jgi:hypothetical protein
MGMPGSEQEQAKRELAESSAVFAGEVVSITKGEPYSARRPATFTASFRVSEVWKGPERETLEVSTPRDGMSCGYRFSVGREYLVYASGKGMNVYACGQTTPLSEASADLEVLDNGETLLCGGWVRGCARLLLVHSARSRGVAAPAGPFLFTSHSSSLIVVNKYLIDSFVVQ